MKLSKVGAACFKYELIPGRRVLTEEGAEKVLKSVLSEDLERSKFECSFRGGGTGFVVEVSVEKNPSCIQMRKLEEMLKNRLYVVWNHENCLWYEGRNLKNESAVFVFSDQKKARRFMTNIHDADVSFMQLYWRQGITGNFRKCVPDYVWLDEEYIVSFQELKAMESELGYPKLKKK